MLILPRNHSTHTDNPRQPMLLYTVAGTREYAGMPDPPEYMRRAMGKQQIYRENGRDFLFLYPRDLRGRNWPGRLYQRLEGYRVGTRGYFKT